MKRLIAGILLLSLIVCCTACAARESTDIPASEDSNTGTSKISDISTSENSYTSISEDSNTNTSENNNTQEEEIKIKMNVQIGDYTFTATLEQNQAVNEFVEMMREGPVTIEMSDYAGFEKVGPLGKELTTDNHQTTTTEGDIVLYNGNQIVIFYGSNSWSYTRIGKIDDLTNWKTALGSGDVTAVFTIAE